ncbi:MAG TPA: DUF3817 domain-containing protein [Tepidisphaeraceae bacterium]|nr:DUF3817 domain-containing protein [Tepidisphaeraceae bacterium]
MTNPVSVLRQTALIEGISFLLLLGVAMPLKYAMDIPWPVKVVGWAHGVLFMLLCVFLLWTLITARWPLVRSLIVFVSALVPFGPFLIDRRMKAYAAEYEATRQLPAV